MRTDNFLLELGTEELPPKSLRTLMSSFSENMARELRQRDFSFAAIKPFGTPRRLCVMVSDLHELQSEQNIEKRGPSVAAAYSDDGEPTKALRGFAKSCNVEDVDSLERLATAKGEWVVFRETRPGKSIFDEMENIVSAAINNLPVERRMRWGASRTEFVRPVHWLLALYGKDIVDINILDLNASRVSYGHRFMHPEEIVINDAADYAEACRAARVIVDFEERRQVIETALKKEADLQAAQIDLDDGLLDEVTALVEWPVVLSGSFDDQFLQLPEEVLISAMKEHQRYFHLRDSSGALIPRFITVANILSTDEATVIKGNERVIRPRLSDASFFFSKDTATSLEQKLPRLSHVVFQAQLGTYHDKATRIGELAGFIAQKIGSDSSLASRAGLLCKADLVSDLVGEFPDLQGVMGGYYAAVDKEPAQVCDAISQHYCPTGSGSGLPTGKVASCVAVADKLDTLVGVFGIGQSPTGSKDPYGLRRQSLGVIRIIIENRLSMNLRECLEKSADLYKQHHFDIALVHHYILDRLTGWYRDFSIDADVVQAVRNSKGGISDLKDADEKIRALSEFKSHDKANSLIAANKRVANILKETGSLPQISSGLFIEPAENDLFEALSEVKRDFSTTGNYQERLVILAHQQDQIDSFFDKVLVMADDADVRLNRLATLANMRELFLEVADFSLLQSP